MVVPVAEAATGPVTAAVGAVIGKVTWTERNRPSSTKNAMTFTVTASDSATSAAVFPLMSVYAQTVVRAAERRSGQDRDRRPGGLAGDHDRRDRRQEQTLALEMKQTRSPVIAWPVMSCAWATQTAT